MNPSTGLMTWNLTFGGKLVQNPLSFCLTNSNNTNPSSSESEGQMLIHPVSRPVIRNTEPNNIAKEAGESIHFV